MGYGWEGNMMGSLGVYGVLTWLVLIVFLVLGSMYFWKGLHKKK